MSGTSTAALRRELLVRYLDAWLPRAVHRSRRRLALVQAYAGDDDGLPEASLDVLAEFADRLGGRQVTMAVLAPDRPADRAGTGPADRAGTGEPAPRKSDFLFLHRVAGGPAALPAVLVASQAAGAPLLAHVDLLDRRPVTAAGSAPASAPASAPTLAPESTPATVPLAPVCRAVATGRPGELLLVTPAAARDRDRPADTLAAAGFPLVTEVELVPDDGSPAELVVFATSSGHGLDAFKDALWDLDEYAGVRYRDPRDPDGHLLDISLRPHPGPLRRELLARLADGPASVVELRRFATTATVYRSADVTIALTGLLGAGLVSRTPEQGRLGGDVVISRTAPTPP
ncbi:hypothetical protein [Plantactinospora sp. KBS50]|uniref:hypothetical protein n=1 Tax=Plantactinospora sp. KBS50 TaxID=2024580 RepID=UPI000BAB1743|nr:hypothetical protein [Plantactinospora sp. KBS50]ASW54431.1 hypothetical protein CIK06_09885 [Plantactinospora sp. KBS50]